MEKSPQQKGEIGKITKVQIEMHQHQAAQFSFPRKCACCGAPATRILPLKHHVSGEQYQGLTTAKTSADLIFPVPYCSVCHEHSARSEKGNMTIGIGCFSFLVCLAVVILARFTSIISFSPVWVVVIGATGLAAVIFVILGARMMKSGSSFRSQACTSEDSAVSIVGSSVSTMGLICVLGFTNKEYANSFVDANRQFHARFT